LATLEQTKATINTGFLLPHASREPGFTTPGSFPRIATDKRARLLHFKLFYDSAIETFGTGGIIVRVYPSVGESVTLWVCLSRKTREHHISKAM